MLYEKSIKTISFGSAHIEFLISSLAANLTFLSHTYTPYCTTVKGKHTAGRSRCWKKEQCTCNAEVVGSSPALARYFSNFPPYLILNRSHSLMLLE
eukprot:sb/3479156/